LIYLTEDLKKAAEGIRSTWRTLRIDYHKPAKWADYESRLQHTDLTSKGVTLLQRASKADVR